MSTSSSLLHRLSHRPRLVALLVAALVIAGIAAVGSRGGSAGPRSSRPGREVVHPLGLKGLELAALTGKATLYLRMPPVTPATAAAKHASDVSLTGVSWALTTPTDVTTGQRSGRTTSEFSINKQLDQFSPALANAEIANNALKTATIYVIPTNQRDKESLTYTLTNVIVTSDHQRASTAGSSESLTFIFEKLQMTYVRNGKSTTTVFDSVTPST